MTINAFDMDALAGASEIKRAIAAGYVAAGIYITKQAMQAELPTFLANCAQLGFKVWLIDEGAGSQAVFAAGATRGMVDGQNAARLMQNHGVPPGTPIYIGIDFAATAADVPNIEAYLSGYMPAATPYKVGLYADGAVASVVHTDVGGYVPGASSWPGTQAYLAGGKAAIVQHPPTDFLGMSADPCEVLDMSILWQPGTGDPVVVTPPAATSVLPDLKTAQAYLQSKGLYQGTIDGIFGPQTSKAFEDYYV